VDEDSVGELTLLINEARSSGGEARERLIGAIYGHLGRIARSLLRREMGADAIHLDDLVQEALIRLLDGDVLDRAPNRRYLFAAATRAMRQTLIDQARRRNAVRRGAARGHVPLDRVLAHVEGQSLETVALNDALDRLVASNERPGLVVTLRFLAGLSVPEVAEVLGVSIATVENDWRFARAWLNRQLESGAR
jgi:RNA polymerase sigma factor (TIGR02999 family)